MSIDKQAVAKRLAKITAENGGRLTTSAVIADAKDKKSPLHRYFDWDIKSAAVKYWKKQAQDLIASVQVDIQTTHRMVSCAAYLKDPTLPGDVGGYVSVATLRDDSEYVKIALIRELKQAAALFERAFILAEALGMAQEFDEFRQKLKAIDLKLVKAA